MGLLKRLRSRHLAKSSGYISKASPFWTCLSLVPDVAEARLLLAGMDRSTRRHRQAQTVVLKECRQPAIKTLGTSRGCQSKSTKTRVRTNKIVLGAEAKPDNGIFNRYTTIAVRWGQVSCS